MLGISFQAGGSIPPSSSVYVVRKADHDVLQHLRRLEYVQLTEPRQQGKTSLILRMRPLLAAEGYVFTYIDMSTLGQENETTWYSSLTSRVFEQIPAEWAHSGSNAPHDGQNFRLMLRDLCASASNSRMRLVLALDEVGSTQVPWATFFYTLLREMFTLRNINDIYQGITVILAGAFDPRDLIQDDRISPFNIAQKIDIDDFTIEQVRVLVAQLGLHVDQIDELTSRIYFWTDGQPYLTQRICLYLSQQCGTATPRTVDTMIGHFMRDDVNHLPRINKELNANPSLVERARRLMMQRALFTPAISPEQFRLAHVIGVIKPDAEGCCRVRNRIYEQAFPELSKGVTTLTSVVIDDVGYRRSFAGLKECLTNSEANILVEFQTLQDRFYRNIHTEHVFGSSENTRNEHAHIIYALNEMALRYCGSSFDDLNIARQSEDKVNTGGNDHEVIDRLQRIEDRIDHGRTEDQRIAAQVLDAINQNRIQQSDAILIATELRAWVESVEQQGLPLDRVTREALDKLTDHRASAYQYLEATLPIIPGILSYKYEVGTQHQVTLQAIWDRLTLLLMRRR